MLRIDFPILSILLAFALCASAWRISDSGIALVGASQEVREGVAAPFRAGIFNFAIVSILTLLYLEFRNRLGTGPT